MTDTQVEWAEKIEARLGRLADPPPKTRRGDTSVKDADGWTVTTESGWTLNIPEDQVPARWARPEPGDAITVYTAGSSVVGIDLRGQRLYLKSEREHNLEWLLFRARMHRQRREEFAREKPNLDRAYDALPDTLKARIDRFREDPDFRAQGEGYEMSAVADAPKIARAVGAGHGEAGPDGYPTDLSEQDAEKLIEDFRILPYDEQQRLVPDLNEGHSGNTLAGATQLAYQLLTGQPC